MQKPIEPAAGLLFESFHRRMDGCGDGFEISSANGGTFHYYFDASMETYWGGSIVKVIPQNDPEPAVLIIKIIWSVDKSGFFTMPAVGKYFAYSYRNPGAFGLVSGAAFKAGTGQNTGVATAGEAEREYTRVNGYFNGAGFYAARGLSAQTLGDLSGDWVQSADADYRVEIKGTTWLEFYDDDGGGFDRACMELYDIVDCVKTGPDSGVLYMQVAQSTGFTAGKYIAYGWLHKTGASLSFAYTTGMANEYKTVEQAKAAKNDPGDAAQFTAAGHHDYVRPRRREH